MRIIETTETIQEPPVIENKSRLREMLEATEDEFLERFEERKVKIEQKLELEETAILESLQEAIESIFDSVVEAQTKGKKEEAHYISFAVLFSDMLLERYGFHIEIFDVNLFLDESFTATHWALPDIYTYLKEDMQHIERSVKEVFTRVTPAELFELESYYSISYTALAEKWLRRLVNQLTTLDTKEAKCNASLQVLFGFYMEGQEVLRTWEV